MSFLTWNNFVTNIISKNQTFYYFQIYWQLQSNYSTHIDMYRQYKVEYVNELTPWNKKFNGCLNFQQTFAVSNLKTHVHKYVPQIIPPLNYKLVGEFSHVAVIQSLCDTQSLSYLHSAHHSFEQWKLRSKTLRSKRNGFHSVWHWKCKRQRRMSVVSAINMYKLCAVHGGR